MLEYLTFFGDVVTDIDDHDDMEASASIGNIYPNPFSGQTTISFHLEDEAQLNLDIYSLDGRKVASLVNGNISAGNHEITWDGTGLQGQKLNAGIYLCTLKTNSVITTQKIILY
jgi:flagellar hook assembly protein FlgD